MSRTDRVALLFVCTWLSGAGLAVGCSGHGSSSHADAGKADAAASEQDGSTDLDASKDAAVADAGQQADPRDAGSMTAGHGGAGSGMLTDTCGGVSCPKPTTCDTSGPAPECVCPAGYIPVDVGGGQSPCIPLVTLGDTRDDQDGGA